MKVLAKRKSEMWVSNNRVLVGGSKKVTGRNPNFDTDETKLLISLWGDPKIQKTLITTHKKHAVITKLAEKMREYGYQRSAEEINTRIKNLKCFYNRIKKDQEAGLNSFDPTWKHYSAMDEIMTRPIFSVRPNEIPKPSLRYKLEEARREREEKQAEIDGGSGSGSASGSASGGAGGDMDEGSDDDEGGSVMIDTNSDVQDDEMDCVEEKPMLRELDQVIISSVAKENTNSNSSSDVEDTTINIKDEPIEVHDDNEEMDDDKDKDDDEADMFPLSEYLKLTHNNNNNNNNNNTNNNKIITTIATSLNKETNTSITSSQTGSLKLSQPTTIVLSNNKLNGNQQSQGKISLVPTNFLMKQAGQQPQQIQLQQQPQLQLRQNKQQHRIIYTQAGSQSNTGIVNTNNGPMKVLLVNTLQKGAPTPQAPIPQTPPIQNKPMEMQNKTVYAAPLSTPQISSGQQQQRIQKPATVNLSNMVDSSSADKINLIGSSSSSKPPTGYRALLSQLVKLQAEGNQISRHRMQIEKERLQFEQTIADKFFGALPNMTNMLSSLINNQQEKAKKELPKEAEKKPAEISTRSATRTSQTPSESQCKTRNSSELITLQLLVPKTEKDD